MPQPLILLNEKKFMEKKNLIQKTFLFLALMAISYMPVLGQTVENGDPLTYPTEESTNGKMSSSVDMSKIQQAVDIRIASSFSTRIDLFDGIGDPFWTFVTVEVSDNGQPVPGLTAADFTVLEDGAAICDLVVTSAGQGGSGQADFVFIVDNSGSMGSDQANIDASIADFVAQLDASGIDYRLGLTRYGGGSNGTYFGGPILEDNGALFSDGIFYRDNIWSRNVASGGFEPGYQAIVETVQGFTFRPTAQKIIITVSDESLDQNNSFATAEQADALAALNSIGATMYAATTSNSFLISQAQQLTGPTGGEVFPLRDPNTPWSDILDDIVLGLSSRYTLAFQPCPPFNLPTGPRDVDITVNTPNGPANGGGTYTPGETPSGRRTAATAALKNLDPNVPVTLELETIDLIPPDVTTATLFYRTTGTTIFTSVPMSNSGGGVFSATVPGFAVQPPGLDYYFSFTDGLTTASAPVGDPTSSPYQVAVTPNQAPVVVHTNPSPVAPGVDVPIMADVTDDGTVAAVNLYYRESGALNYIQVPMTNTGGDTYEATIPGSGCYIAWCRILHRGARRPQHQLPRWYT